MLETPLALLISNM